MLVLQDTRSERRLQVALAEEDADLVRAELAGFPTPRSALYALIEGLLHGQAGQARVRLTGVGDSRIVACILLPDSDGASGRVYPTSTADGAVLATRAGLPLYADEALLERFGTRPVDHTHGPEADRNSTPVPLAFRRALQASRGCT
jgi:hypothetical protein